MNLKTPIAYFESRLKGGDPEITRGPAIMPKYAENDDGSKILSFSELFRVKLVDVLRVVRDSPNVFEVVSINGERVTLRPLTLAAYRRYIKAIQNGPTFETQAELEAWYMQPYENPLTAV